MRIVSNNFIDLRIDVVDDTVCKINGDNDIVGMFANTKPRENPMTYLTNTCRTNLSMNKARAPCISCHRQEVASKICLHIGATITCNLLTSRGPIFSYHIVGKVCRIVTMTKICRKSIWAPMDLRFLCTTVYISGQ